MKPKLKVLCSIGSTSRLNGGVFEAERQLQACLHTSLDNSVIGLEDQYSDADRGSWGPLAPRTFKTMGPIGFGYSPGLLRHMLKAEADLVYSAGLWRYHSLATLRWAQQTAKPYMVAPHGMLDPWAVGNSKMKKMVADFLYQRRHLKNSACIRALNAAEVKAIRAYGLTNPVCVIPNGVLLPETSVGVQRPVQFPTDRKVLLYLGRLHPKKGLANLVTAWSKSGKLEKSWVLAIAGWAEGNHEQELRKHAQDKQSILFLGPQFDHDKAACFRHCDGFILPSLSEGLPMAILEAWSYGKAVIMTAESNLPEGFREQAALRIIPTVDSITEAIHSLAAMSDAQRSTMGEKGLNLVRRQFGWPKIAEEMHTVFEWMLGGEQPACLEVDYF